MGIVSPVWGPFNDPLDAKHNLCEFTNTVLGPDFGAAWIAQGSLYTIRRPIREVPAGVQASRNAALAQRYAEIGEAAQKRAQAAQARLQMFVTCRCLSENFSW